MVVRRKVQPLPESNLDRLCRSPVTELVHLLQLLLESGEDIFYCPSYELAELAVCDSHLSAVTDLRLL